MSVNKHDRLQLIRRAAEGEAAVAATAPEPTKTSGTSFYRRGRSPQIPPKYDGRHRALGNSMFTTLRSSS